MKFEQLIAENDENFVKRDFEISKEQDDILQKIQEHCNLPPSGIVRLALGIILPRLKYGHSIQILLDESKF